MNTAKAIRPILQLKRLEVLTDVVFGIVLWRTFMLIPQPEAADWKWKSVQPFLADNLAIFAIVAIGIALTIIYWVQNNALLGSLEETNVLHTSLSILQIFFLLLFLYSIRLGMFMGASPGTRTFESVAAAMVGISGGWAWMYATKNRRLVRGDVTDQEVKEIGNRIMAEPITALITIPFAWIHGIAWEVSWLSYLIILPLVKRKRRS